MTRHFLIEDRDGSNPRHVTLAEFLDAQERGDPVRLAFVESDMRRSAGVALLPSSTEVVRLTVNQDVRGSNPRSAAIAGSSPAFTATLAPASLSEAAQALADC